MRRSLPLALEKQLSGSHRSCLEGGEHLGESGNGGARTFMIQLPSATFLALCPGLGLGAAAGKMLGVAGPGAAEVQGAVLAMVSTLPLAR